MDEEKLEILKQRAEFVQTDVYKSIRHEQIEKIISLATSQIDPSELRGMLKLINYTDNWQDDYKRAIKKIKENRS